MKTVFTSLLIICLTRLDLQAQNIGINATGAAPAPSAMLDISAIDKGFLMPRMTTLQRNAIASPAEGLKVYDTDTKTFWFFNGTGWIQSATGSPVNFWSPNGTNIFNNNAGNVGIGLNTPLAPLHIRNDNEALRLEGATPYISFKDSTGVLKGFLQNFNNDLYLGTPSTNTSGILQLYLQNNPVLTALPSGNIGIGTSHPGSRLTLQTSNNTDGFTHQSDQGIVLTERIGGVSASIGTSSKHTFRLMVNNNPLINLDTLGNVGVGLIDQSYKMDIADAIRIRAGQLVPGVYLNNPSNSALAAFMGVRDDNLFGIYGFNGGWGLVMNMGNGNVGIGRTTGNPTNKLQIGSVGATGFATNDLAIGNGTNAMGIFQTNASTLIGATTDIILMPRNNGHGRVGINTTTPRAPLDVVDDVLTSVPLDQYSYINLTTGAGGNGLVGFCQPCQPTASIYASSAVVASEFDAYSDARIKNIVGQSSSVKDLETINSLLITDYTMKDKVKYGKRPFKKVIAQQVENVYPQVISRHTDFIPNVYQPTTKIEKATEGWLLSFAHEHMINSTAKKIRIMSPGKGAWQDADIISIPSATQVIIQATDLKTDTVFVYGEQVGDFRTVDYEGLTTLNISATQELSRLIKSQQKMIEDLQKQLAALEAKKIAP